MTLPAATMADVSRETRARLDIVVAQLRKWQPHINLVSPASMADVESRHVLDSLQLAALVPQALSWIDLGSGGGFPGLVVAATLADRPSARVTLVESNAKKCAYLRESARMAALPVEVVCARIEDAVPRLAHTYDVVSARALASLDRLLLYAEPLMAAGAIGLFPKGEDVDDELDAAFRAWHLEYDLIQSMTERKARIVRIRSAARRTM